MEEKKPAKTYLLLKPAVSQPTASPGRRALCHQRYVDRTGGKEVARCSNTYVANEITCDGTLDMFTILSLLSVSLFLSETQDNTDALYSASKTPSLGTTRENEAAAGTLPLT